MKWLELKIIPPLVTFIIGVLMWLVAKFTPSFSVPENYKLILALIIVIDGVVLLLIGAYFIKKAKTTINPMRPDKSSALVTNGLYRFSRNPIYLADLVILIGWGVFLANIFSLSMIILFVLYMNRFQIIPEERFLEEKFGKDYLDYKAKARRWI